MGAPLKERRVKDFFLPGLLLLSAIIMPVIFSRHLML